MFLFLYLYSHAHHKTSSWPYPASVSSCVLHLYHLISTNIALVIPAAYYGLSDISHSQEGLLIISRGTSILLLGVYVIYIYFQVGSLYDSSWAFTNILQQLKSHAHLFDESAAENRVRRAANQEVEEEEEEAKMSTIAAAVS